LNGRAKNSTQKHFATLPSAEENTWAVSSEPELLSRKTNGIVAAPVANAEGGQQRLRPRLVVRWVRMRLTVKRSALWREVRLLKAFVNKELLSMD